MQTILDFISYLEPWHWIAAVVFLGYYLFVYKVGWDYDPTDRTLNHRNWEDN